MASTGILHPLVLLVQFTDHANRSLPPRQDIEQLWNANAGPPSPLLPTGSISEYLRRNSYDNLIVDATVVDWHLTDNTELYYSFDKRGLSRAFARAIYPVLRQLDQNENFDFSPFDRNNDGIIDALVVLHSGFPSEVGGKDCYNLREREQRIWSHAIGQFTNEWFSNDGNYRLGSYMVASALRGNCGGNIARIGVMAHEFVHLWGIPDLYDIKKVERREDKGKGIGKFDMMSDPYGIDEKQTHPNHMSPWTKIRSGWLEPIEITGDGLYTIEASAISPSVYVIRDKFPASEYILIENRQQMDWDVMLWSSGLLIWHIDDSLLNNTERGYPGQPGWPGNGNHYKVAVSSGDRNYDLEKGINSGDATDFWRQGQELRPGLLEFEATDFTKYPNTNSYWKGSIWPTGIRIFDISASGTVMSFRVAGLSPATPAPSDSTPLPSQTPSTSDPSQTPSTQPSFPAPSGKPSTGPSVVPSAAPSLSFSASPSTTKSESPSVAASITPTIEAVPTPKPTEYPTWLPTPFPSDFPSALPTTPSAVPTSVPSVATPAPTTQIPSEAPSLRSSPPSQPITSQPVTSQPTDVQPITSQPIISQPNTAQPITSQPATNSPVSSSEGRDQLPPPTPFPTFPPPPTTVAPQGAAQPTDEQLGGATPPTQNPTAVQILPTIDLSGLTTSGAATNDRIWRHFSSSSLFLLPSLFLGSYWILVDIL